MTGHESFSLLGVSKILTIDQDLRPPADFGEANLGWDPLIIGDVHHCRRISMRGQLLMTRGLLFKSKDHVIQPLGGISTSLKSVFLILTNTLPSLYQLTQPGSPIDQVQWRHFSEGAFSLIKHLNWVGDRISWLSIDIKQQQQGNSSKSLCQGAIWKQWRSQCWVQTPVGDLTLEGWPWS